MHPLHELIRTADFPEGSAWTRRRFEAGQAILTEGQLSRAIYLIESGEVCVTTRVILEQGRQIQPGIAELGPGEVFGELTLLGHESCSATVKAMSEVSVIEFNSEALRVYLDDNPDHGSRVFKSLFQTLVERLTKANRRTGHLMAWGLRAHGIEEHL